MPRFEVTKAGANGLEIGAIVEAEYCPTWLVNKCRVLPGEKPKVLEVATPKLGRPPKEKEK
jgi:hypothetical protein